MHCSVKDNDTLAKGADIDLIAKEQHPLTTILSKAVSRDAAKKVSKYVK